MKKYLTIIVVCFVLYSCGKDEKVSDNNVDLPEKIAEIKPPGPTLKLKYKFKKGERFSYKLQTKAENTEEIIADTTIKNEIKQNATYRMDFTVKNLKENNSAELDVKISSIVAETIFNDQPLKYDSKFIYSSRERAQFVDYEAVKNVPFRITVNEIGQVTKVERTEKIMRNILEIRQVPDTLSAKTKEEMLFNISNGTLMPLTQQIFKVLSYNEVGIDSVWQLKFSTPIAVFNVENTAVFKVKDFNFENDTTVNISSNLLINVLGNNIMNEQGVTYSFSQPLIDASGSVKYNYSRGLVEVSNSVTNVEMTMYMEGVDSQNRQINSTKKDFSKNTNIVELL